MADYAGPTIAHDTHVKLDRCDVLLPGDLFQGFELVIGMGATTDNRDIARPANICESARHVVCVVVTAARNKDSNGGAPGFIGVAVSGDILAAPACFVDQRDGFDSA